MEANAAMDVKPLELLFIGGKHVKWYRPWGGEFVEVLTKLNIHLLYDPVIVLLSI